MNGKSQPPRIDYDLTFSPVVKYATIRVVLFLDLSKGWVMHQLDVNNAFLHGHLNETVYMHQPLGFRDPLHPDFVCRLKKSLYWLKYALGFNTSLRTLPHLGFMATNIIILSLSTRMTMTWLISCSMVMTLSSLALPFPSVILFFNS